MPKFSNELERKLELARRSLRIPELGLPVKRRIWNDVAELACDIEDNAAFQEAFNVLSMLPETTR